MDAKDLHSIDNSPVGLPLYVKDVDATAQNSIQAGLKVIRPIADQFYGEQPGKFLDPFGHLWTNSSCIKEE